MEKEEDEVVWGVVVEKKGWSWGSWLKSFELTEELCVCTTREAERLELVICMVKNGDFDIFIGGSHNDTCLPLGGVHL
ncbi:hypothetical protein DEO72_LG11g3048 [Vigna unguiculata]|uniref:Uncharacterized protein n=1 Tax=Vigna unguiculata TaxID=3917 RepID=A0A4D6NUU3_VIGUN|nr:hypothetical protein DEO72_LG11g3048 [Vigna unguiculata]